jgi:hypothetical protein
MNPMEGSDTMKQFNDVIETETRDLPTCSVTTLPRSHHLAAYLLNSNADFEESSREGFSIDML